MIEHLKPSELTTVMKIINAGLERAAASLKMILNSAIEVTNIDFHIEMLHEGPQYFSKTQSDIYVLGTTLIGELKGVCHLLFTHQEVQKIYHKCLPPDLLANDSESADKMKIELLKEIDNIMAASVITEFANHMDINVHGSVPSLRMMGGNQVNQYIYAEAQTLSPLVQFRSVFHIDDIDIQSDFIWLLEEQFVHNIKNIALEH